MSAPLAPGAAFALGPQWAARPPQLTAARPSPPPRTAGAAAGSHRPAAAVGAAALCWAAVTRRQRRRVAGERRATSEVVQVSPVSNHIDDALLREPWAQNVDQIVNLDGHSVRRCGKTVKQVATLGPDSWSKEMIERLFLCGVDVFRLNFSHLKHDEGETIIKNIRACEEKYMHPIGILADLQGPKQRCGVFSDPAGVNLVAGQRFRFDLDRTPGDDQRVCLPHPEILEALTPGKTLLVDDGKVKMRVTRCGYTRDGQDTYIDAAGERPTEKSAECQPFVECEVIIAGAISAKKGVNTPDVVLDMSPITPKDREDIKYACQQRCDWIALSFVQGPGDMQELKQLVQEHTTAEQLPKLLAKIEKPAAVDTLSEILDNSDGVMVARGDLGVEMSPEEVPYVQKDIITKANEAGKTVIVATQMLESMMTLDTPTRAECSDIANAILDGCDAVMLSGETAKGMYPLECVRMQRRIIEKGEEKPDAYERLRLAEDETGEPSSEADGDYMAVLLEDGTTKPLVAATRTLVHEMDARAVICFSESGRSVVELVKQRLGVPIFAMCLRVETARWLSLLRGVYAYATVHDKMQWLETRVQRKERDIRFSEAGEEACRLLREKGMSVDEEDWIVVLGRSPIYSKGEINSVQLTRAKGPHKTVGHEPPAEPQAATA